MVNERRTTITKITTMDAARCYRLLGDALQQRQILERIQRDFPSSPVSQRARQELEML